MSQQDWDELVKEQFEEIRSLVGEIQTECGKYTSMEQMQYIKPIRYLLVEALSDLYALKHQRIDSADSVINKTLKDGKE